MFTYPGEPGSAGAAIPLKFPLDGFVAPLLAVTIKTKLPHSSSRCVERRAPAEEPREPCSPPSLGFLRQPQEPRRTRRLD